MKAKKPTLDQKRRDGCKRARARGIGHHESLLRAHGTHAGKQSARRCVALEYNVFREFSDKRHHRSNINRQDRAQPKSPVQSGVMVSRQPSMFVCRAQDEDHARSDEVDIARALHASHGNHIERAGTSDSRSRGALRSRSGGAGVAFTVYASRLQKHPVGVCVDRERPRALVPC